MSLASKSAGGSHLVVALPGVTIAGSGTSVFSTVRVECAVSAGGSNDVFAAPMRAATDATRLDTTQLSVEGVFEAAVGIVESRRAAV